MLMHGGGGFWPLGFLFPLLFWALLIGGLIWFVRRRGVWRAEEPARRSLEVLGERYARGEIDRDEYLERRSVLEPRRS